MTELGDIVNSEHGPLDKCIENSERENLWKAAKRVLNDEVYAAMWLRYVEDMSVNDISGALDRSNSWTKVNLMRGRKALETEMNRNSSRSEAYG